jgi:hypothetical protein
VYAAFTRCVRPGQADLIITAHQAGINDQAYHHLQKAILDGTLPRRGPIPA